MQILIVLPEGKIGVGQLGHSQLLRRHRVGVGAEIFVEQLGHVFGIDAVAGLTVPGDRAAGRPDDADRGGVNLDCGVGQHQQVGDAHIGVEILDKGGDHLDYT